MLFTGNFALISPASLLQALCVERRSARLVAWRGASEAHMDILEGLIVAASCDNEVSEEAVYRLVGWESGQFQLAPLDEPPDDLTMAAEWELLVLEAARRRDETAQTTIPLAPDPTSAQVEALLIACPAIDGLALVGCDGRLLAVSGMADEVVRCAATLAGCLAVAQRALHEAQPVIQMVSGTYTLLLADWGHGLLVLARPAEGWSLDAAIRQLASGTYDGEHLPARQIAYM